MAADCNRALMRQGLAIILTLLALEPAVRAGVPKPQPKKVDFYGDPLPEGALARLGTVRLNHLQGIGALALSPDGKMVASLGSKHVRLWDTATGKELRRLHTPTFFDSLVFSPDGRLLVTTTNEGQNDVVQVWDVQSGKEVHRFEHRASLLRFAAGGKKLLIAERRGEINRVFHLRDLKTGKREKTWKAPPPPESSITKLASGVTLILSPDEKVLVWTFVEEKNKDELREVNLFMDAATGKVRFTHFDVYKEGLRGLVFSPDGKNFATGSFPIHLYETASGKKVRDLDKSSKQPLLFSPDGRKLAWGDKTVCLEDLASGRLTHVSLPTRFSGIEQALAFSGDGKLLAVAAQQMIRLWDIDKRRERHDFPGHRGEVFHVNFSADGGSVYTLGGDPLAWREVGGAPETLCQWQAGNGRPAGRWAVKHFMIASLAKKIAVTSQEDGTLILSDWLTGKKIRQLAGKDEDWTDPALSPGWRFLAIRNKQDFLLVEVDTGKEIRRKPLKAPSSNLVFSPDGRNLAWCAHDGSYHIEDALTGKHVQQFGPKATGMDPEPRNIFYARDGTLLVRQGYEDNIIQFWQVGSGRLLQRFAIPINDDPHYLVIALSPDNRTLAAGYHGRSGIGQVRLFEVISGQERRQLNGHHNDINHLTFSPDGSCLASASSDGTALIWDMNRPGKVGSTPKNLTAEALAKLWKKLAGPADSADDALWALAAVPEDTVPFLKKCLQPVPGPDRPRIQQLIADLGSNTFSDRQKAFHELGRMGDLAQQQLTKALAEKKDLEVRQRIGRLLEKLLTLPAERLRELRAVAVLERIGTPSARAVLEALAHGAPEARQTKDAQSVLQLLRRK